MPPRCPTQRSRSTNSIVQYTRQPLEKQESDDGTVQGQLADQSPPASSLVESAATLMGTRKGGDNWDGEKQGEYGEHAFRERCCSDFKRSRHGI